MFRDEMKKINRDKVQLTERLKEAEGAQLRLDGEVHSLKSTAMAANERHDASLAQMEKKLQKAQDSAQSKQEEVHLSVCIVFDKQISKSHSALLCHAMCLLLSCGYCFFPMYEYCFSFPLKHSSWLPVCSTSSRCLKIGWIAIEPSQWWQFVWTSSSSLAVVTTLSDQAAFQLCMFCHAGVPEQILQCWPGAKAEEQSAVPGQSGVTASA